VELRIIVGPDGRVTILGIKKALGFGLDEKAIDAVSRWEFVPGTKDGKPVPVYVDVLINFSLRTDNRASTGPVRFTGSAATTDVNGEAVFRNLAPGRYNVVVDDSQNAFVEVTPERLTYEISFNVAPASSIRGQVKDRSGQPLTAVRVVLSAQGYRDGRSTLSQVKFAETDSRGEYLLTSIPPGEYFLSVEPRLPTVSGGPVFYPGVRNAGTAKMITIRGGEDLAGLDFGQPDDRLFTVSGKVLNLLPTGPAAIAGLPTALGLMYSVVARDLKEMDLGTLLPYGNLLGLVEDGTFSLAVPRGSWDLIVIGRRTVPSFAGPVSRNILARVPFDIADANVRDLTVSLIDEDIKGRVTVSGAAPATMPTFRWSLLPVENGTAPYLNHLENIPSDGKGEFTFPGVPPGKYVLEPPMPQPPLPPSPYSVADIRSGTRSVFANGILTVGPEPPGDLEIVIRNEGATVAGVVEIPTTLTASELSGIRIALVPEGSRRQNLLLYRSTSVAGTSGRFIFPAVQPGEYKVFAWRSLPIGGAERNAQFLARYEEQGTPVTVTTVAPSNLRVRLIP
jgi:TonB family protein